MKKQVLIFIFDSYADWEPAYLSSELNSTETEYVVVVVKLFCNSCGLKISFYVIRA